MGNKNPLPQGDLLTKELILRFEDDTYLNEALEVAKKVFGEDLPNVCIVAWIQAISCLVLRQTTRK